MTLPDPANDRSLGAAADVATELGTDTERGLDRCRGGAPPRRRGPEHVALDAAPAGLAPPAGAVPRSARLPADRRGRDRARSPGDSKAASAGRSMPSSSALIVLLNAVLGFVHEARAANAVAALARMTAATSSVLRAGELLRIPSDALVRGDLLVLGEGDAVGADARLLRCADLRVQEASLTGESEAVLKDLAPLSRARGAGRPARTWCGRAPRSRKAPAAPSSPRPA